MSSSVSVAASLSPDVRKDIGIQALSGAMPISRLAEEHQVSRKFVYQQGDKAQRQVLWADASGWTSPRRDAQSKLHGGESQLSPEKLLFPAKKPG